jgi:hypothetical protein
VTCLPPNPQVALYSSIPLQLFPVLVLAENALLTGAATSAKVRVRLKRCAIRVLVVAVVTAAAVGIPDFGLLMSLIGVCIVLASPATSTHAVPVTHMSWRGSS